MFDVLHISTHSQNGGAARAAYRLHQGLLRHRQIRSGMFVLRADEQESSVVEFLPDRSVQTRVRRRIRAKVLRRRDKLKTSYGPLNSEIFSDARTLIGPEVLDKLPAANLYNLHWINGFVDVPRCLHALTSRAPVVWTMHDMNTFTGGCHYDRGCQKYVSMCGGCPQLSSSEQNDFSRRIWDEKHDALRRVQPGRIHFVANSDWLAIEARKSALLQDFPVSTIHYGLDERTFCPREKLACRSAFGLPQDAKIVLFVADYVDNERKGLRLLTDALRAVANKIPSTFLLSVGRGGLPPIPDLPHLHAGGVSSNTMLAALYSAADVFVIPSTQEAFGQTALEAMACGVPPVGFNVGGIVDMIQHGFNGLLADVDQPETLAARIVSLLDDSSLNSSLGAAARDTVLKQFTLEMQANAYEKLYDQMLRPA